MLWLSSYFILSQSFAAKRDSVPTLSTFPSCITYFKKINSNNNFVGINIYIGSQTSLYIIDCLQLIMAAKYNYNSFHIFYFIA